MSSRPAIHTDVPLLTTRELVKAVQNDKPLWRSLQSVHEDAIEAERQRIRAKYDTTLQPLPDVEWDIPDEFKL